MKVKTLDGLLFLHRLHRNHSNQLKHSNYSHRASYRLQDNPRHSISTGSSHLSVRPQQPGFFILHLGSVHRCPFQQQQFGLQAAATSLVAT